MTERTKSQEGGNKSKSGEKDEEEKTRNPKTGVTGVFGFPLGFQANGE